MRKCVLSSFLGVACVFALASWSRADIDPISGIDFVTIGAVGNSPWLGDGTPGDNAIGRGRVDYQYNIGKTEVPLASWVEFMNAAWDRPAADAIPHMIVPFWGAASATPQNGGQLRWSVPAGREMWPVGAIHWRTAAIYCNWLSNGKSLDRAAFMNGAYDVSTFGYETLPSGQLRFTDQAAHNPGARYYIPTWDEWLKAAHYDPNKPNQSGGTGDWWLYSYTSDTQRAGGLPGVGNGNYGFGPTPTPFNIPLGAYANVVSPWGLLDTAGATSEWTESVHFATNDVRYRILDGSPWASSPGVAIADWVGTRVADYLPNQGSLDAGLRIVMSVPSSPTVVPFLLLVAAGARRRRIHGGSQCVGKFSVHSSASACLR